MINQGESHKPSRFNHVFQAKGGEVLAFNGTTEALAMLDDESWSRLQALLSGASLDFANPIDAKLIEGNFFIPTDFDEIAHLKERYDDTRNDQSSWGITICPTITCNFGCDYCFELKHPGRMAIEVQDAILKMLLDRRERIQTFHVTWFGGEPTLAWDVIEALSSRFISICESNSIAYSASLITNGYRLDSRKVSNLQGLGIRSVQVTLDGDKKIHDERRTLRSGKGTFERILDSLKLFIGQTVNLAVRINIDGRNKDGIHSLIEELSKEGLAGHDNISIYFAPVEAIAEHTFGLAQHCLTRKDFARVLPEYYAHAERVGLAALPYPSVTFGGCIAVKPDGFVVLPDGELHKCWDTVGHSQYAVGNILESTHNFSLGDEYQAWMKYHPFDNSLSCSGCSWLPSCMGGCPLRVVHPELSPSNSISYDCTPFKFNMEISLPMYVGL